MRCHLSSLGAFYFIRNEKEEFFSETSWKLNVSSVKTCSTFPPLVTVSPTRRYYHDCFRGAIIFPVMGIVPANQRQMSELQVKRSVA